MKDYCWYAENAEEDSWTTPHASAEGTQLVVGSRRKRPNAWGLCDMSGNVWEYCQDWYDEDYYANSPTDDPVGPSSSSGRVIRGGSWDSRAGRCRSAYRSACSPGHKTDNLGFRVVLVPAE